MREKSKETEKILEKRRIEEVKQKLQEKEVPRFLKYKLDIYTRDGLNYSWMNNNPQPLRKIYYWFLSKKDSPYYNITCINTNKDDEEQIFIRKDIKSMKFITHKD